MAPDACDVERYCDGTVLVRVHSFDRNGRKLPDAVFTFRLGDPQYSYWVARAVPASQPAGSFDGVRSLDIVESTRDYEAWLAARLTLVPEI